MRPTSAEAVAVVEGLEATRRAMRSCRRASAVVALILAGVALASTLVMVDVAWVLPGWWRRVDLAVLGVVALAGLIVAVLAPGSRYDRSDAAREVEHAFPELGQRVRTTLEYTEARPATAPASPSLVAALVADTGRKARGLEFLGLVPWPRFRRRALALTLVTLAVGIATARDPNLQIGARRLLLLPAHYTTLAVEPGDRTLKAGADFTLKATLAGRAVASAHWLRREPGSAKPWESAPLAPADERPGPLLGALEATRRACREGFEYKVVAGEVESPVYRVTVTNPLVLKGIEASVEPPAYTRRPATVAKSGNFSAPEGSKVRFRVTLDRGPRSARLSWAPAPTPGPGSRPARPEVVALKVEGNELMGDLPPLARDVRYEILAEAADGQVLEPAGYRIKVQADQKPTVRFVKPAESFAATPTTEVRLKVEAGDDHGVARVGIAFRVGDGPEESLLLEDPKGQPPSVESLATLYLEKHRLAFTDSLSYRGFVEDNRPGTPLLASTELRFIDILPYKLAYQMAEGGACDGSSVTLEELIARQRRALNRTFAHADDGTVDPAVADRLSQAQAELALATEEFAKGLIAQFGGVPPLQEACQSMRMATVALAQKDIAAAIPAQQSALTALIQARRNLRKLLSNASSAGQCQKFDRQMDQKLRKPPTAEDKPKEAELARLEQDVRKLAEQERKFAEEIAANGGGGAQMEQEPGSKPGPTKPGQPKPGAGANPSPADRQAAAAREADRLAKLARQDKALSDLARSRMGAAADRVKDAEGSIKSGKPAEAGESARAASEQLGRLADQIGALKSKDLAARLAAARELARATAGAERDLAGPGRPGDPGEAVARQAGLIEGARTLADVLDKLGSDAAEEDRPLGQALARATGANAPVEIEAGMRQAEASLASEDPAKAARELTEAAGRLEALARDVEAARRAFVQPRLEQLLAAERKAAEVGRALDAAADASKKLEAEKAMGELARAVEGLKPGEGPLREAAAAVTSAANQAGGLAWGPPRRVAGKEGFFTPPTAAAASVGVVARALQAKIQEMVLDDALVDRDGAVPPGFKDLVDRYFRVLSEDLR